VFYRVDNGAVFTNAAISLAGATLNIYGHESIAIVASGSSGPNGTGVVSSANIPTGATVNLIGEGSSAALIEGGAQGRFGAGVTVNLTGEQSFGGVADGQGHDFAGRLVGTPVVGAFNAAFDAAAIANSTARADAGSGDNFGTGTILVSDVSMASSADGVVGYYARNGAYLVNTGNIDFTGIHARGVEIRGFVADEGVIAPADLSLGTTALNSGNISIGDKDVTDYSGGWALWGECFCQHNNQIINTGTITVRGGSDGIDADWGDPLHNPQHFDPYGTARSFGIYVSASMTADMQAGGLILEGQGAVGAAAFNGATLKLGTITSSFSSDPNISNQIMLLLDGPDTSFTAADSQIGHLNASGVGSTLVRLQNGATGTQDVAISANGQNAQAIWVTGINDFETLPASNTGIAATNWRASHPLTYTPSNATVTGGFINVGGYLDIDPASSTFGNVITGGKDAVGIRVEYGATATLESGVTVRLIGDNAHAGLVDGRETRLDGTQGTEERGLDSDTPTVLTNRATITTGINGAHDANNAVAFTAQYGGTIINQGLIDLNSGTGNIGIELLQGGHLENEEDITVADGIGVLLDGGASTLSNTATITVEDGTAGIVVQNGASLTHSGGIGNIVVDGTASGIILAAANTHYDEDGIHTEAGIPSALSAHIDDSVITVKGSGNGIDNLAEISDVHLNGTVIEVKDGAGIRTATPFVNALANEPSNPTITVTGKGYGVLFQQADGTPSASALSFVGAPQESTYTITVTGAGGTGAFTDATGLVALSDLMSVDVQHAAGGSALKFGDKVTTGSNDGTLTSISAVAPTVDANVATHFTNTGTISNTSAGYGVAVLMNADNATLDNNDGGVITGNVVMNGADATVNIGATDGSSGGTVTGDIQLAGGTNAVLITGGSMVGSVTSTNTDGAGTDTVTVRGQNNDFGTLTGTAENEQTLVLDDANHTVIANTGTGSITHYDQVNLLNGSVLTLQAELGGDPEGGAGIDVDSTSILAVASNPASAFVLANQLTGSGLVTVNTGAGNAFDFAATTGDAFTGTVALGPSTFALLGVNTDTLANATLRLDTGSVTTVGAANTPSTTDKQSIGGLTFNGGTAFFGGLAPTQTVADHSIEVSQVLDVSGTGYVQIAPSPGFVNELISRADIQDNGPLDSKTLLAQDDGLGLIKLVSLTDTGSVVGTGGGLTLIDMAGNEITDTTPRQVDIRQDVAGAETKVAIGTYNIGLTSSSTATPDVSDGLYLGYGLKQVELLGMGAGALVLVPAGQSALAHDLSAKITGTGDLAIEAGSGDVVSLSNPLNDYTGVTFARTGTLRLDADHVLGLTSDLRVATDATVDTNDHTQTVGAVNTAAGSHLILATNSTLTISDTQRAAGDPLGGGIDKDTLSGAGALVIDPSTLYVNGDQSGYTGQVTVTGGSTLILNSASAFNKAGGITLDTAADTLIFGDTAAYDPTWTDIPNGITAVGISGAGNVAVNDGADVTFTSTANTYSGNTDVNQGALRAGAVNVFSAASAVNVASTGLLDLANFNQTVAALNNAGTVRFGAPVAQGAAFTPTTLTVTGDYVGNGGTLQMRTQLGDDASPTDKLVIGGNASGKTTIALSNANGLGALTSGNGIELVNVGGTSASDAFKLAVAGNEYIDAGAFRYRLFNGPVSGTDDNWYLRSQATPPPPVDPDPPTPPGPDPDPRKPDPDPEYRPEVPWLDALPGLLRQGDLDLLGTLHQRVGDDLRGTENDHRLWARVFGSDGLNLRQDNVTSPQAKGGNFGFQGGIDLYQSRTEQNRRNDVGILAGKVSSAVDVSGLTGATTDPQKVGRLRPETSSIGAYWTFKSAGGFYLDLVGQKLWYGGDGYSVDGNNSPNLKANVKGDGYLGSLEIGQSLKVSSHWLLEPQAQLIRHGMRLKDIGLPSVAANTPATNVSFGKNDSTVGRLGIRLAGEYGIGGNHPWTPYVRANWWHGFDGNYQTSFSTPANVTTINTKTGYDTGEVGVGFTVALNENVSLYSEVDHRFAMGSSASANSRGLAGSIGVRIGFGRTQAPAQPAPAVAPPPPMVAEPPPAPPPPPPPPPAPVRVTLSADALFDFDSAELRPAGRNSLDNLVRDLGRVQYDLMLIGGHTDRLGSESYNQRLSERRANAVRDYLIGRGVPAANIRASGFGKSQPVTTPQQCTGPRNDALIVCLQPDRRVDVQINGLRQP
jgi:autotransporter family porin